MTHGFKLPRFHRFVQSSLSLAIGLTLVVGCQKSSETGQTRTSQFKPTFAAVTAESTSNNQLDTGFINSNHFACVVIDVPKIRNNPDLADVPWDALTKPIESIVGQSNADLEKITRVWVLFDKSGISFGGSPVNPTVFVLEYDVDFDVKAMELAQEALQPNDDVAVTESMPPESEMQVSVINPRRVAIGAKKLIESMGDATEPRVPLNQQLQKLSFDSDIEGAFTLEPIQPMVAQITSMFARVGGDQFDAWRKLPQALRSTLLTLSLTEEDMFHLQIRIEDKELAKLILESAGSTGSNGNASSMGPLGAMAGLTGASPMGRGPRGAPGGRFQMRQLETPSQMEVVGKEIRENGLFTVKQKADVIHIRLKRPENLPALIKASVEDSKSQYELLDRTRRFNLVANAMKKYHKAHGVLPPANVVSPDNELQLPAQFNWQTGLLKYIDEEQYKNFRFDEAWDSEHNLKIAATIPDAFASASMSDEATSTDTHWMLVGGAAGVYRKATPITIDEIKDSKTSTALVVEVPSAAKTWTSPSLIFDGSLEAIGNDTEKGAMFINAKFKVRAMAREHENFGGFLTTDGDEDISLSDTIPMAAPGL